MSQVSQNDGRAALRDVGVFRGPQVVLPTEPRVAIPCVPFFPSALHYVPVGSYSGLRTQSATAGLVVGVSLPRTAPCKLSARMTGVGTTCERQVLADSRDSARSPK